MRYLEIYADQMSVLQARASLIRIREQAFVHGGMDENDRRDFIRELQHEAGGKDVVQPRPKSMAEMAKAASGHGVHMVTS